MDAIINEEENTNKKIGKITSIIVHILLLIFAFLPLMSYPDPPPGQEGILISLGEPDVGDGEERLAESEAAPASEAEEVEEEVEEVEEKEEPKKKDNSKAEQEKKRKVLEDKASNERKLKSEKEAKKKASDAKKKADAEAKKQAAVKAAKAKAEADAKAKAEAEAKKYNDAKSEFGDLFGGGKGDNGKPGNQGNPDGDPNASNLDGISSGSGLIGGGLKGRKVKDKPKIEDKSQAQGKVVVNICVDDAGKVISAKYTQKGSTTTNSQLIKAAERGAKKYKFEPGTLDKQCGTVTIDFRLK